MSMSRTASSIKNSKMSIVAQICSILLNFIGRTFFIRLLNIEYLGVNGLFSNILGLLSLAELGVGTAITYMMYKPIAENDIKKVAAYNNLFRKVYTTVGLIILGVGLVISPFINFFIREQPDISENLFIIYVLFLLNTSISYFFTYKRSLLIAYQKEYINSVNILQFSIIKDVVLILLLWLFHNFYIYLIAQIVVTFLSNFSISRKTDSLFPEIVTEKNVRVTKEEIHIIVKNTMAMLCHKVGSVIVSGTGNLFVSYYVGISVVGIYSNYLMISTYARQIIGQGVNSITASFGNLVATESHEHVYKTFRNLFFINFILAYMVSILFYSMINPFISLWIGNVYLLDTQTIFVIVINSLFFYQIRVPSQIVINTYGLFWQVKWKSIIEAFLNLLSAFILASYFRLGICGILAAGLISNILTNMWWEPYAAFKYGLHVSLSKYFSELFKCIIVFGITLLTVHFLSNLIVNNIITNYIIQLLIILLVDIVFMLIVIGCFYGRTAEFKYFSNLFKSQLLKNK